MEYSDNCLQWSKVSSIILIEGSTNLNRHRRIFMIKGGFSFIEELLSGTD